MDPNDKQTTTEAEISAVPQEWPGAFGLLKHAKVATRTNLQTLLLLIVTSFVASLIVRLALGPRIGQLAGNLVSLILLTPFTVVLLKSARQETVNYSESFKASGETYVNVALNGIVVSILLVLSFFAVVVPFFIVLPRMLLTTYFVVDKGLNPIDAIKASWEATKGRVGMMYGIIGAGLVFAIIAITIIGIPFAVYFSFMYSTAYAIAYLFIQRQTVPQTAAQTVAPEASIHRHQPVRPFRPKPTSALPKRG